MSRKKKTLRIPLRKYRGGFLLVEEKVWSRYLKLGFSESVHIGPNGHGSCYPKVMAYRPDPSMRRPTTVPLARIVVAIIALMDSEKLDVKGWIVRPKNGDPLDLRRGNLQVVVSRGQKNSINASWIVNVCWDIAESGGDPKAIFAARRRVFRATHKAAIKGDPESSVPPSPRPRKTTHRGQP